MIELQGPELRTLAREECLELLSRVAVGRLGYVTDGIAVIVPVNFAVSDGDIVFCLAKGSVLNWLSMRDRVSFQADECRDADREGWSVLIHGTAREVTEPRALELLRPGSLTSWLRSPTEHWVRLTIDTVSGRALLRGGRAAKPQSTGPLASA